MLVTYTTRKTNQPIREEQVAQGKVQIKLNFSLHFNIFGERSKTIFSNTFFLVASTQEEIYLD